MLLLLCCVSVVVATLPSHISSNPDRVIKITNGTAPWDKFVEVENIGKIPHKIDVRFDFIGLPTHTSGNPDARYSVTDLTAHNRPLAHPKDSFGANLLPGQTVKLHIERIQDEKCLYTEAQHKCFEACGSGSFHVKGFLSSGKCPAMYDTVDEEKSVEQCRDGTTNIKYCPGSQKRVVLQMRTKGEAAASRRQTRSNGTMDARAAAALGELCSGWYDSQSGLWDGATLPNGAQWWNSANSLEVIANYGIYGVQNASILSTIANTFEKTSLAETLTGRYDDEGWWSLGWIRAYELTGQAAYLTRAEGIFNDLVVNAWDETCGGGVWWSYAKGYKNAITNELFFVMAIKLHEHSPQGATGGKSYLAWAQTSWDWFEKSGMINKEHLINDGLLDGSCTNNGETEWTYNQGVLLGGLAYLYRATHDAKLLNTAVAIAEATTKTLVWPSGVLKESCDGKEGENSCDLDQQQFKGIFVRYLNYLIEQLPAAPQFASQKNSFANWIKLNSETIWSHDRDVSQISEVWDGRFGSPGAVMQTSGLDAIISKSALFPLAVSG